MWVKLDIFICLIIAEKLKTAARFDDQKIITSAISHNNRNIIEFKNKSSQLKRQNMWDLSLKQLIKKIECVKFKLEIIN